tara:strand:- start:102 stop:659 length:558 start_codon:yes stop_codon:yes gene_type:complete
MPINNVVCGTTTGAQLATITNEIKTLTERGSQTYWFVTENGTTAISHTGGATDTYLTNSAAGAGTTSYNPDSKAVLWNTTTNKFDFTSLKIGDVINITGKLTFNNLAAQEVDMFISAAEGTASAHEHQIDHTYYKTAKAGRVSTFTIPFLITNEDERTGGARFRFASVQAASITVGDWTTIITSV